MVKKLVKSILTLGLLLSVPQFLIRAEGPSIQMVDFDSQLQPHDLMMLDQQDEPMVYMPQDFAEVIRGLSSDVQSLKDLIEHVKMDYSVAPMQDVSAAIEHVLNAVDAKSDAYSIVTNYQQALLSGEALVKYDETGDRRRKRGRYCTLYVRNCATVGCLNVRNGASICGNLSVSGTISACNLSFTGTTGCTATASFPSISSAGNVVFNTAGVNTLNAVGGVEARLRDIRGTIALASSSTGVVLTPTTVTPGAAITVTGVPSATISSGAGFGFGTIVGTSFSSAIDGTTALGSEFYLTVDLQIPVIFSAYSALPTIFAALQYVLPPVSGTTSINDANTATVVQTSISNVTTTSAVINVLLHINAQGADYATAVANAQTAVNNIISTAGNPLSLNLLIDGPVV